MWRQIKNYLSKMSLIVRKSTSPGLRDSVLPNYSELHKGKPHKASTLGLRKRAGRNNLGKITVRRRGGGHARKYRLVDFSRTLKGNAIVRTVEYDPNRTARIALLEYDSGKKSYVLATSGMKKGDKVGNYGSVVYSEGNSRKLTELVEGTEVHNIELIPGQGGKIVRAAGTNAQILGHEGKYTLLRLPSGEVRYILRECRCTVGTVSNLENKNIKLGKAGRNRHRGRRPSVRGSAMAPNSHPHGGGEGKAPIGLKYPKTLWGKHALGVKTRRNKRSNKFILRTKTKK